jgi:hypothetical protein
VTLYQEKGNGMEWGKRGGMQVRDGMRTDVGFFYPRERAAENGEVTASVAVRSSWILLLRSCFCGQRGMKGHPLPLLVPPRLGRRSSLAQLIR